MPRFGSMADVAMESEGKTAGGRVTCSCGGGCDSSRYDLLDETSLSKKLGSSKKNAGLITHYFGGNRTPKLGNFDFGTTIKQYLTRLVVVECIVPPRTSSLVSLWLSRLIMCGAEFWSVPRVLHVSATNRN